MNRTAVAVRVRPVQPRDVERGSGDCALAATDGTSVCVTQRYKTVDLGNRVRTHGFKFDRVFGPTAGNQELYVELVQPLVGCALRGASASVIAYGQTGSGKTHTMLGTRGQEHGLYVMAALEMLQHVPYVDVSMFQIYNGSVKDLLSLETLRALTDARGVVHIKGLQSRRIDSTVKLQALVDLSGSRRASGCTAANSVSSRSHAVMQLTPPGGGVLSVVDLAGSERGKDTSLCDAKTRQEGAAINTSLLALKEVIRAMAQGHAHVNWRASLLTKVLQGAFSERSMCSIVATVSPADVDTEHSLNTLLYANRVKELPGATVPPPQPQLPPRRPSAAQSRTPAKPLMMRTPNIRAAGGKKQPPAARRPVVCSERPTMPQRSQSRAKSLPRPDYAKVVELRSQVLALQGKVAEVERAAEYYRANWQQTQVQLGRTEHALLQLRAHSTPQMLPQTDEDGYY